MEVAKTSRVHSENGRIIDGITSGSHPLVKISKKALERSETARLQYRIKVGAQYRAEQLVFVDESACDRRTFLRKRAWALQGHQATRKQFFARGKRFGVARVF